LDKILRHESFYNAYLGFFLEIPHVIFDELGEFIWGEGGGGNFRCGASAALFSVVCSFFATVFGTMSFDFAIEALIAFH
jgi:hypothetical protein